MEYGSFDQLIHDESFIEKLNNAATPDEATAMCAEYGFDVDKELNFSADEELDAAQLDGVAGGLSWKQARGAWKFGMQAGVVIRNCWDLKHGKPLTYPNWKFEW